MFWKYAMNKQVDPCQNPMVEEIVLSLGSHLK